MQNPQGNLWGFVRARTQQRSELDNEFELADGCETIHAAKDITIFYDQNGVERAVFRIDGNRDPLPHCDPNTFGYALIMINFIDAHEGVAICEVTHLASLLAGISDEDFEAEVISLL